MNEQSTTYIISEATTFTPENLYSLEFSVFCGIIPPVTENVRL